MSFFAVVIIEMMKSKGIKSLLNKANSKSFTFFDDASFS